MIEILSYGFWLAVAFLIGSVPTAYLAAKAARGIDIRRHGSGNVGAANIFRVMGKGWGTAVLIIDILKGCVATAILANLSGAPEGLSQPLSQLFFGAAAVSGHTWTPWLGLKGGKGIATSAGALLGIFPLATGLALLIWCALFLLTGYVSLASMIAAAAYPLLLLLGYRKTESFASIFITSLILVTLLIYNHRANLARLRRGEEPRVQFKRKPKADSQQ